MAPSLVGEYADFASLERACAAAGERFNTRVHRETGEQPAHRLLVEQAHLHRLPPEPYTVAFGETRTVSWSSLISFQGARYSVPHQLCEEVVFVRCVGNEVVIVATGPEGPKEVARHPVAAKGQMTLHDGHYPPRRKNPERAPKASTSTERAFLALGEGARRYLVEAAAAGAHQINERMGDALALRRVVDAGVLDEALGLAALAGRFEAGDLDSIISIRREPLRRISEDHSLQPGTAGWARLGELEK